MLRWFRDRAPRLALLAIVVLGAAGGSAATPHQDDCHDAGCASVRHDASAHRITAPTGTSGEPIHCVVCHWARSFRPRTESRVLPTPAEAPGIVLHIESFAAVVTATAAQPPLRSPPASPALA